MFPIRPVPKTYSWGSDHRLQELFGVGTDGPLAEMWFSGHAASPSPVDVDGETMALDEAIRRAPELMVGTAVSETWGPVLPYLFKIISARIPLSLQVHPLDFEARAGFNRENAAGIPLDSPVRSFKDTLAKHEMVVALEDFEASVGFAPRPVQLRALNSIDHPLARAMAHEIAGGESGAVSMHRGRWSLRSRYAEAPSLVDDSDLDTDMPASARVWGHTQRRIFRAFRLAVTAAPDQAEGLTDALRVAASTCADRRAGRIVGHALQAAEAFPGDPSVLCVAMLNAVHLGAGESVFIPAGTPHCYLHGTGAEIMTNSDNVLRAGMTPKHKDIPNLLRNLNCTPAPPIDPTAHTMQTLLAPNLAVYRPDLREFMLSCGQVGTDADKWWGKVAGRQRTTMTTYAQNVAPATAIPAVGGPRVLVCVSGRVRCTSDTQSVVVGKGESYFIPASDGRARVTSVGGGEPGMYLLASTSL